MIKIFVVTDDNKITKTFRCLTNNIPVALSMYENECGEFEHLEFLILE
jgi:hypothetical protein